jgi:surface polysaccharide O-acyltransferase-like enzyme
MTRSVFSGHSRGGRFSFGLIIEAVIIIFVNVLVQELNPEAAVRAVSWNKPFFSHLQGEAPGR